MKVIIIGAGKLGYKLAESMINSEVDVTLVDSNPEVINRANEHLDLLTVCANGLEIEILKDLEIETYDLLIAATSSDETNTIICSLAKKLGCKRTISRIRNPEYTEQLDFIKREMGIDHIINPDLATADEILKLALKDYNFYSGDFAKGKVQMIDICVNNMNKIIGKKLMEIDSLKGLLIAAISRDGKIKIPDGSTKLEIDDIIYFIGKRESIEKLVKKYKLNSGSINIKNVMILGGGKIGYYLANKLSEFNIKSTVVEQNNERCVYLMNNLKKGLVIHGDGTDLNLLEEENLSEMDAFIAVTGFDEQNILMSLLAKQSGIKKVITKISRPNYTNLIEKLDLDIALNPVNITVSDILRYIRGGKVVSVSLLLGDQAEVTEVIVDEDLPIVGKAISDLGLSKGIIIGALVHNGDVIIPNGNTIINKYDRLIIYSLVENVQGLDMFFKKNKEDRISELWNSNKSNGEFAST